MYNTTRFHNTSAYITHRNQHIAC